MTEQTQQGGVRGLLLERSFKTAEVEVGGERFTVRELSGAQRQRVIEEFYDRDGKDLVPKFEESPRLNATLVAMCALDEAGDRAFEDEDWRVLHDAVSVGTLDRAARKILELSALDVDVEVAAGNSSAAPTG